MQLGIKEHEVALAHRALNFSDGMAHQASQTGIRLRRVHDLLDRCIHHPAVKNRGIVTASTPFRWTCADNFLHVLNALSIPLVIKRREVMSRTAPLFVYVFMTALACLRLHKVLRRNQFSIGSLRGAGKEESVGTVA